MDTGTLEASVPREMLTPQLPVDWTTGKPTVFRTLMFNTHPPFYMKTNIYTHTHTHTYTHKLL